MALSMIWQLVSTFIEVVLPVFGVVLLGYLAGPRLKLEARTLSRAVYFFFMPAFTFYFISQAEIQVGIAAQMVLFIFIVHIACALLGLGVAKLLNHSSEMTAAYVLIAIFGNVGNFGLSVIIFRFGQVALAPTMVYFLAINIVAFGLGVAVASSARSQGFGAIFSVFRTPVLLAFVPGIYITATQTEIPLFLSRMVELLADAAIPVMLVTLGVQLAQVGRPEINLDVFVASAVRLLGGPVLATILIIPFGLTGLERSIGILMASMPAAAVTSIIAIEYDVAPRFVTTTVLFSTLTSLITLTILLSLV